MLPTNPNSPIREQDRLSTRIYSLHASYIELYLGQLSLNTIHGHYTPSEAVVITDFCLFKK